MDAIGPLHAGIQYYEVFFGGAHGTRMVSELDLRPYDAVTKPSQQLVAGNLAGYQAFQRLMTHQRLVREFPLRNNIYAFNASRTRFYPYQFKPLIKLLDSPHHRLLICDEVGLGKTIEAGLILTELRARQTMRTVLVVCPSNLTGKWKLELHLRFGDEFRILKVQDFLQYLDDYENAPDRADLNAIVSLESIRVDTVLERLEALTPSFDLVIVDEAHHMRNFGRRQRQVGELLSQSAAAMIMLTATPVQLGSENLFSLLNILDAEDFPDQYTADLRFSQNEPIVRTQALLGRIPPELAAALSSLERAKQSAWVDGNPLYADVVARLHAFTRPDVPADVDRRVLLDLQRDTAELNLLGHIFTRTRKRDVHTEVAHRRAFALELEFSPLERSFYDAVSALVKAQSEAAGHMPVIQQWRLNTPRRRMASSLHAMVEHYRRAMPWEEADLPDDLDVDDGESVRLYGVEGARAKLTELLRHWPKQAPDSKYDRFLSMLRELRGPDGHCKVIVFATFVGTLDYLARRLTEDGFGVRLISGQVAPEERPRIIVEFRDDPAVDVFLSSRVGSEGLDFQFCDTMFNYDLPWNPMEVEQRIGRLDRIGQESPVIRIYNFWVKETIEERILRRLYERIGIFERSIGDLEAILGNVVQELERDVFSKSLTPAEQAARVEQVALALEAKLRQTEALESDAARFIGTDAYFEGEITAIRERRRYVTGEQLRRFLEDFLRNQAPRARLEYDRAIQSGRLVPDDRLRDFVRRRHKSHELTTLLSAGEQGLPITFDSQVAFRRPNVDFINVLHPLITAIVEEYAAEGQSGPIAQHVVLRTDQLSQGFYFFFVFRLRVHAARGGNTLESVILQEDGTEACDSSKAEVVLGEMVESGEEPERAPIEYDPVAAQRAYEAGLGSFLTRVQSLRAEIERSNDLFVERRLASLKTSYSKNIQKQKELLVRAQASNRQERYLRLLKGTITRLESELAEKANDLEGQRSVEIDYDEIAAGVLEVA